MASRAEVIACGCREDDLAVLKLAVKGEGARLRIVESAVKVAHQALSCPVIAVVLGVGPKTLANLEVIPVLRDLKAGVPVIVIATEDSLEMERSVREKGIFYYLVHPVDSDELTSVLADVGRRMK